MLARSLLVGFLCAVLAGLAVAGVEVDAPRAHANYMLYCQGCHLSDAMGYPGRVPRMNGVVGYFPRTPAGRAFIIQVPGVAHAPLPDDELSELMNWMLMEFSAEQLPVDFKPYTADEVARLKRDPERDPMRRREELLAEILPAG